MITRRQVKFDIFFMIKLLNEKCNFLIIDEDKLENVL